MNTLLVVTSSMNGQGAESTRLALRYAAAWQAANPEGHIVRRDLATDPLPHLDAEGFAAFAGVSSHPARERSDALIAELRAADEIVLAIPMYNFAVPSTFKAWIDHVARAGVTFRYGPNGPEGLLADRPVTIIATRGGRYAGTAADNQSAWLRQVLGFIGLGQLRFVYAEGLASGGDARTGAVESAGRALELLATPPRGDARVAA